MVSQAFFGVQTFMRVVDGCLTTEQPTRYPLLEQILSPANLNTAYRQVMRNKGAAGIVSRAIGDESLHKAGYSWIGCYYSASALPKG